MLKKFLILYVVISSLFIASFLLYGSYKRSFPGSVAGTQIETHFPTREPDRDTDLLVECNIDENCGGGWKRIRQSECNNSVCCQIDNKWIFYPSREKCEQDQKAQYVPKETQIECWGPDGKSFMTTQKECDEFNTAWGKSYNNTSTKASGNSQPSSGFVSVPCYLSGSQSMTATWGNDYDEARRSCETLQKDNIEYAECSSDKQASYDACQASCRSVYDQGKLACYLSYAADEPLIEYNLDKWRDCESENYDIWGSCGNGCLDILGDSSCLN